MKKFIMITPLQPVVKDRNTGEDRDLLQPIRYEAIGNSRLTYEKETRFPLMHLLNGYAEEGEEIKVITVTPNAQFAPLHLKQLEEEIGALQKEKGFVCAGVESISVAYAGDVDTQIDIFHKLLDYFEDGDALYACLTFGNKPMPIAELMAIQYAYRVLRNVTIDCLIYGEFDHSSNPSVARVFDITALVQLDEIVRVLADQKVAEPKKFLDRLINAR